MRKPLTDAAPWPLFIALRYLKSGRKDAFVSFLSAVAVGGIALGVAALIVALAGLTGLQRALRAEVLGRTSQIEIEVPAEAVDPSEQRVAAVPGVRSVSRQLRGAGWIVTAGSARPVQIVGYQGRLSERFPGATRETPGVYVSGRLARLYGLEIGESIELASARPTLSPVGPVPRVRRLRITGLFDGGTLERRERIAVPLEAASDLLGTRSLHLVVTAGGLEEALALAPEIEGVLPDAARLRTWGDLNAPLLFALQLEKRLMFVAVFLVVAVGALALVSDLSLIIASRRAEIGILGTIGAEPGALRKTFLALGGLLATIGLGIGLSLGVTVSAALDHWQLIRLPGDAYLLDHVPFHLAAVDLFWVTIVTLATAMACAWIGADRATSLRPVEALHA